jgi:hypothetical protein
MAAPIQPLVLDSIGIYGLNKQSSPSSLEPQWLTEAQNVMLDEKGNVTTRKGIRQISDLIGTSSSNNYIVKSLGEYRNATGSSTIFAGSNDKIYKLNTANTPYTLDAQTFGATPVTLTDGNWEFSNFNNKFYAVQAGHQPITYDGTTWTDLADIAGYAKPTTVTTFNPSCMLGSFGRLWVGGVAEAKDVVYYSDTLIGEQFSTGAAGSVDMKTVWGGDEIVALANFMGKLIIFGKRNIAIYNNPDDPAASAFALDEVVIGVGCVARDSVQALGDDVIFLSNSGVRSLQRTMVKDKMPLTDLSLNVKDEITLHIVNADMDQVKGQYCLCGGYYVLSFPDRNIAYVFDFKGQAGQAPRITTWEFETRKHLNHFYLLLMVLCILVLVLMIMKVELLTMISYYDVEKADVTATYANQTVCEAADNTWESANSKCWSDSNNTYQSSFKTTWLDFGTPSVAKLLKRMLLTITGGFGMTATLNWYRDYSNVADSSSFDLSSGATVARWGTSTAIWGTSRFSASEQPTEYKVPLSKSAKVLRLGMTGTVNGFKPALQNMIVWAKQGKIR